MGSPASPIPKWPEWTVSQIVRVHPVHPPRAETGRGHRNPGESLAAPEAADHRRYQNGPSSIGDVFGAPTVHRPSHPITHRDEGVNVSGADAAHGCRDACTRTRVATQHTSVMHHPRVESRTPQGPAEAPVDGPPRQGLRCAHGRSFHRAAATACTVPGAGPPVLPARLTAPRAWGQDQPYRSLARSCHTSLNRPFTVPCPNPVAELLANAANHASSRDDTLRGCAC